MCTLTISGESLEEVVKPEIREVFEAEKKQWLAWGKWSNRTPGLFKLEFEGRRMIALCSKCYFAEPEADKGAKLSTKGMSKAQNEITWGRFKAALHDSQDMAINRGFRMRDGRMMTYEQTKKELSAYYDKRWVLEDGLHTEPLEYHGAAVYYRKRTKDTMANKLKRLSQERRIAIDAKSYFKMIEPCPWKIKSCDFKMSYEKCVRQFYFTIANGLLTRAQP